MHGRPQALGLVGAHGALLEMGLEAPPLGVVERVEQIGPDVLLQQFVTLDAHPTFSASACAQLLEAEPHPALHGADRHLEHLGYLAVAEAPEVGQLDHARLLVGQLAESIAHLARVLAACRLHVGLLALGRLVAFLDALGRAAAAVVHEVAPQGVDGPVVHDAQDPGPHASPVGLVARLAAPYREERLLRDVLGRDA